MGTIKIFDKVYSGKLGMLLRKRGETGLWPPTNSTLQRGINNFRPPL